MEGDGGPAPTSFPLRCVEALLDATVDGLASSAGDIEADVRGALQRLRAAVGVDKVGGGWGQDLGAPFDEVRALRERVRALLVAVHSLAKALGDVLDDDGQMAFMCLKRVRVAAAPGLHGPGEEAGAGENMCRGPRARRAGSGSRLCVEASSLARRLGGPPHLRPRLPPHRLGPLVPSARSTFPAPPPSPA